MFLLQAEKENGARLSRRGSGSGNLLRSVSLGTAVFLGGAVTAAAANVLGSSSREGSQRGNNGSGKALPLVYAVDDRRQRETSGRRR